MADTVRYLMEEMVPELEDMVKHKYFSKEEVKQIVKRRQDFEYLLKRKAALKEDFLRYIEYESRLDALRVHRRQALGLEGKAKKSLADFAIVRRIHFIFERAVRKFKTDLSLWTAWLEFCRSSNSNRRLGRVVARALQIHPTEPGLWVYAAAWEFEANGNPAAARALMQQGLRMCRDSHKMWLDYFDLELMYVEKLVARRRILGLDVPEADDNTDADTSQQQQQQQEGAAAAAAGAEAAADASAAGRKRTRGAAAAGAAAAAARTHDSQAAAAEQQTAEEDGEGPQSKAEAAAAAGEATIDQVIASQQGSQQQQQQQEEEGAEAGAGGLQDAQAAVNAMLLGGAARLVYQHALKAAAAAAKKGHTSSNYLLKPKLGSSSSGGSSSGGSSGGGSRELEFRAGFLRVLGRYSSPGVAKLTQEVIEGIRADFPADPVAADLLARAACDPTDTSASPAAVEAAVAEYERLLGHTPDTAAAAAAAGGGSKASRSNKRQKTAAAPAAATDSTAAVQPLVPPEVVPQVYRLYCRYLQERLQALSAQEEHALAAAAVAQQLFKLLASAHKAGTADEGLYSQWVTLAQQLQQNKLARKAARLATEAHPASASSWQLRLQVEAEALGIDTTALTAAAAGASNVQQQQQQQQGHEQQQQQQQLLALVMQALQQVPAAEAVELWDLGFSLAQVLAAAAGGSSVQLTALQKQLVAAVTAAAVKGPETGGLGAVAGRCLEVTWHVAGAAAARKLWQQLLLLPPAGGDMYKVMIELEQTCSDSSTGGAQQQQQRLAADAAKRVRAVYEAWAAAYGSSDAGLWVQWALFEQQQNLSGAGKVHWRAVRALEDPEPFIQQYRQLVGAV